MDYKGSDSPPPYQKLSSEPVYQTVSPPQPGYQTMTTPQPGYQVMSSPQPGYQTMPSPLPIVIKPSVVFRDTPVHVNCSNCGRAVFTSMNKSNGICAFVAAVTVLILFCPCFWIPLVVDSCKDVNHSCPVCGALLGRYKQL